MTTEARRFPLGDFVTSAGGVLPGAWLTWRQHGDMNADRSNVILYPTSYGAQSQELDWLIGPTGILDPGRWCVVQVDMFGNGASTSPSHLQDPAPALALTHVDNVVAQRRLICDFLQVKRLAMIYGWSMGAQQAYYWGAAYPEAVARIAALCGTARTSDHNRLMLMSLQSALCADPAWDGQRFTTIPERGIATFACIYASWAASQEFYRRKIWQEQGFTSLTDYLTRSWEAFYRRRSAIDHLAMLGLWLRCDVGQLPGFAGDTQAALRAIRARTLVMPSQTDLYFTVEDCQADADLIANVRCDIIPSWRGHRAGNPALDPIDTAVIRQAVHRLLEEPVS